MRTDYAKKTNGDHERVVGKRAASAHHTLIEPMESRMLLSGETTVPAAWNAAMAPPPTLPPLPAAFSVVRVFDIGNATNQLPPAGTSYFHETQLPANANALAFARSDGSAPFLDRDYGSVAANAGTDMLPVAHPAAAKTGVVFVVRPAAQQIVELFIVSPRYGFPRPGRPRPRLTPETLIR